MRTTRSLLAALAVLAPTAAPQSELIPTQGRRSHVYDSSRRVLYISTGNGTIQRYDTASKGLLAPFKIGTSLNGLDTTPDESRLYVAENLAGTSQGFVHRVDLESGAVTTLGYDLESGEVGAWDVGIANNGLGFVTTRVSGSGWVPFRELDLATETFTPRTDSLGSGFGGEVRQDTSIHRGADRSLLFMTEPNISSGPVFNYDALTDSFLHQFDTGASLSSAQSSVDRNGTAVSIEFAGGISILDSDLNTTKVIDGLQGGSIFDPAQDRWYGVDTDTNELVAHSTPTYVELFRLDVGENVGPSTPLGNGEMSLSADGDFLFLSTPSGVRLFTVGSPAPAVLNVVPNRIDFDEPPVQVTITGNYFNFGSGTQVFFGDQPATGVQVVDDGTIVATTPVVAGPDAVDLRVVNSEGQDVLEDGFAFIPALRLTGTPAAGDSFEIDYLVNMGDTILAYVGFPPETQLAIPPFAGTLCVGAPLILFETGDWPFEELSLVLALPANPSLAGAQFLFQALVGPDLGPESAFTNCLPVIIEGVSP